MSTTPAAPDAAGAHPAGPFQTRAGAYALIVDGGRVLLSSCLLYTSPSPRDRTRSRMPSSA